MVNKKRVLEWLKTTAIVLLSVSAVYLMGRTGLFDEFLESSESVSRVSQWIKSLSQGQGFVENGSAGTVTLGEASRPLYIAITLEDGIGRCAVKYDTSMINEIYDNTGLILGEALGSSGDPENITESAWQSALSSPGVYYDYVNPLPLSVIAAWLNTEIAHEGSAHNVRRIYLSENEAGGVDLYYISENNGRASFYRCKTALSYSGLASRIESYTPNGANFVFELGGLLDSAESYALVLQDNNAKPCIAASNPFGSLISENELLTAFDLSPYIVSSYPEPDGTIVYVESGDCSLRLGTDGTFVYKRISDDSTRLSVAAAGETPTLTEVIECARRLVAETLGKICGDAVVYLADYSYSENEYVLNFSYYINGAHISAADGGYCATIIISGGGVAEARLYFRTYSELPETKVLLPELQEVAIISSIMDGGELVLNYEDTGGEAVLEPFWSVR